MQFVSKSFTSSDHFLSRFALMVSPVLCPIRASTVRKTMLKRKSVVSLVVARTQKSCIQLGDSRNNIHIHDIKAGESQGWAPGQASDCTLRAPNFFDSYTHDQTFYQDFRLP